MLLNCFLPSRSRRVRVGRAWVASGLLLVTARLLAVYPYPFFAKGTLEILSSAKFTARQALSATTTFLLPVEPAGDIPMLTA